jgi:hypothetical protein
MSLDDSILRKTYSNKQTFILKNDILTYSDSIPKSDLEQYTLFTGFQYHVINAFIVAIIWLGIGFFTPSLNKFITDHLSSSYK